jgi:DNA-binding transcriptional LysR family regulator
MGISKSIELRHLRCFVAVAEELNFRAAAQRLHLSQPPLSRAIVQFEELLGREVFERSRRGVSLTAAGAALLPKARRLLHDFEKALANLPNERFEAAGQLRVGVFFAVHPSMHATLQSALHGASIEVGRSHDLTAAVRKGQLDGALVMLPAPAHELSVQEIGRAEMIAAVPASHSLARRKRIAVAELDTFAKMLFLGRRQNPPLYAHLDMALRSRGLVAPRYGVPRDTYAGLAQIASGEACTILCSWVGNFIGGGISLVPLRSSDRIEVSIGWVSRRSDSVTTPGLSNALQSLLAQRVTTSR